MPLKLKDDIQLELARVERVTKEYDKQGRIIAENVEFYYPKENEKPIGYKTKK